MRRKVNHKGTEEREEINVRGAREAPSASLRLLFLSDGPHAQRRRPLEANGRPAFVIGFGLRKTCKITLRKIGRQTERRTDPRPSGRSARDSAQAAGAARRSTFFTMSNS